MPTGDHRTFGAALTGASDAADSERSSFKNGWSAPKNRGSWVAYASNASSSTSKPGRPTTRAMRSTISYAQWRAPSGTGASRTARVSATKRATGVLSGADSTSHCALHNVTVHLHGRLCRAPFGAPLGWRGTGSGWNTLSRHEVGAPFGRRCSQWQEPDPMATGCRSATRPAGRAAMGIQRPNRSDITATEASQAWFRQGRPNAPSIVLSNEKWL